MKGVKKPEKAPTKDSVQGSSSKKDQQTQKPPAQQHIKEEKEVMKGSSYKAVSGREKTVQVEVFSILIFELFRTRNPKRRRRRGQYRARRRINNRASRPPTKSQRKRL